LGIAAGVLTLTLAFRTAVGMAAAYFGGWIDTVAMRTDDIILAFPGLFRRPNTVSQVRGR
jgi:peptide/nickel transport system permease protein